MAKKVWIDTDTGSDDAVALVMMLRDPSVEVVGISTVAGNVGLEQATKNALMTIGYAAAAQPPVYLGCERPLFHEHRSAVAVHGEDGMGDLGALQPGGQPASEKAVTALLGAAGEGGLEILALGPLTNLALAMMRDPDTMRRVGHITLMGGAYKKGNTGHLAEFNLWEDAEAADYVFTFGVPITMVTIDACRGETRFTEADCARLRAAGSRCADFCVDCNRTLYEANAAYGERYFTLPDAVAAAVLLRPGLVRDAAPSYTRVELKSERAYGATVNDLRPRDRLEFVSKRSVFPPYNCQLVSGIDAEGFKQLLCQLVI